MTYSDPCILGYLLTSYGYGPVMNYLRIMKYPGSKKVLIPDIENYYKKSRKNLFVDVFGGSGSVSLNIDSRSTVYNDLNQDLVNVFLSIQKRPQNVYYLLKEGVKFRRSYGADRGQSRSSVDKETEKIIREQAKERGIPEKDVQSVLLIMKMSLSFGGMGNTYATRKEKASMSYISRTLDQMDEIKEKVKKWKIENMDFRELVERYDGNDVFFYFDPPYSGQDWYDINFEMEDFRDLAEIMKEMEGTFLLTIDPNFSGMEEVFGPPYEIKEYANENGPRDGILNEPRRRAFYTNIF